MKDGQMDNVYLLCGKVQSRKKINAFAAYCLNKCCTFCCVIYSMPASTVRLSCPIARLAFVAVGWFCPLLILMCWESQLHSAESPNYTLPSVPVTHFAEPSGSTKNSSCCWIVSTCKNVDIPCWLMEQFLKLHIQIVKFNSTAEIIVLVHGV